MGAILKNVNDNGLVYGKLQMVKMSLQQAQAFCKLAKQQAEGRILGKESTLAQQRIEDGATLQAICFSPGITVFGTRLTSALAAVKTDGSVIAWGNPDYGGDLSAVRQQLADNVLQVTGSGWAFAAVKTDGSVIAWGNPDYGGDLSAVRQQLADNVLQVTGSARAFAALAFFNMTSESPDFSIFRRTAASSIACRDSAMRAAGGWASHASMASKIQFGNRASSRCCKAWCRAFCHRK